MGPWGALCFGGLCSRRSVLLPRRRGAGAMESSMAKGSVRARFFVTRWPHRHGQTPPSNSPTLAGKNGLPGAECQPHLRNFERSRSRKVNQTRQLAVCTESTGSLDLLVSTGTARRH